MARNWHKSRFDNQDDEPMAPMANLVDLMLVFACGLIAALISLSGDVQQHFQPQTINQGKELSQRPDAGAKSQGQGMESVGQVYRDPETGKLILIGN